MRKTIITLCFLILGHFFLLVSAAQSQTAELVVKTGRDANSGGNLVFSPDGKILASEGDAIKFWEVSTGQELRTILNPADAVVFSPNGRILASGGADKTIRIWDVTTGTQLKAIKVISKINSVAFSPDGKSLAVGSNDRAIKFWDVATGMETKALTGHEGNVEEVMFSRNGKLLASRSGDWTIRIWDVETGQQIRTFAPYCRSFDFSPDDTRLVGLMPGEIKIWDLATGAELLKIKEVYRFTSVAFSKDGKMLASLTKTNGKVELWDSSNGQKLKEISDRTYTHFIYSPDGKLVTAATDGNILADGRKLMDFPSRVYFGQEVAYSPDGENIVFSKANKSKSSLGIWNLSGRFEYRNLDFPVSAGDSLAVFSPDGKSFATATGKEIQLWNIDSGDLRLSFSGHREEILALAISADGKLLVSGSKDKTVRLWDAKTGQERKTFSGHTEDVTSVAFLNDGKRIASASLDKTIRIWDMDSGTELSSWDFQINPYYPIDLMVFSSDDKLAASFDTTGEISLWDVSTGTKMTKLSHFDVEKMAFSADSKILITSGFSSKSSTAAKLGIIMSPSVILWDVATGNQLKSFWLNDPASWAEFSGTFTNFRPRSRLESFYMSFLHASTKNPQLLIEDYQFTTNDRQFQIKKGSDRFTLHESKTGRLVASLFPFDGDDWAVITPEGLFDGSPRAWENMIWRLDNNTFRYAPVEAFFSEFYYPGLLQEILSGRKLKLPEKELSSIDIRQPRVKVSEIGGITTTPLKTGSTDQRSVTVSIEVTDNFDEPRKSISRSSSGAKDLRLFRNGSLVKIWKNDIFARPQADGCRQLPASATVQRTAICQVEVPIVAGDNIFTAYAFNHDNVKSSDDRTVIRGEKSLERRGTLYVLAVGVNEYENQAFNLKYAVPDVEAIGKELTLQQSKLSNKPYAETKVITLNNKHATKSNIIAALKRFSGGANEPLYTAEAELEKIKPIQPEDALIIYFAGHGLANKDRFYLIPRDGIPLNFSKSITESSEQQRLLTQGQSLSDQSGLEQLYKQSISDLELEDLLETVNAGKLMMIIDACNSGQALEAEEKRRGPMNSRGLAQLAYEKGMNILTASQSFQAALEATKLNHGLLTFALLEGLKKGDSNNDKSIIDREWLDYGVTAVPQLQIEALNKRLLTQNKETAVSEMEGKSQLQTPRVFYRREVDSRPLVIALPE